MSAQILIGTFLYLTSNNIQIGSLNGNEWVPSLATFQNGSILSGLSYPVGGNPANVEMFIQTLTWNLTNITGPRDINNEELQPSTGVLVGNFEDGSSILVFKNYENGIYGQFLNSNGSLNGKIFEICASSYQLPQSYYLQTYSNQSFVFAWVDNSEKGGNYEIYFRVNQNGEFSAQHSLSSGIATGLAVNPNGSFVLGTYTKNQEIYVNFFSSGGQPNGEQIQIAKKAGIIGGILNIAIGQLTDENYIAIWNNLNQESSALIGQMFNINGPVGNQLTLINGENCESMGVGAGFWTNQSFVLAWYCTNQEGGYTNAQMFNTSGQPYGNLIVVDSNTGTPKTPPTVATWQNGSFVISYMKSKGIGSLQSFIRVNCETNKCVSGSYCNKKNNECVQCLINGECTSQHPVCTNNICSPCSQNSECGVSPNLFCNQGECQGCSTNSQCSKFNSSTPFCNINTGLCVVCLNNSNCKSDQYCYNSQCVSCINNNECSGGEFCHGNTCVECLSNNECESEICDQSQNECVDCLISTECSGEEEICHNLECVECVHNSECTTSPNFFCKNNTCSPCTSNSDCSNGTFCVPNGLCEQCEINSECPNGESCCSNYLCKTTCPSISGLPTSNTFFIFFCLGVFVIIVFSFFYYFKSERKEKELRMSFSTEEIQTPRSSKRSIAEPLNVPEVPENEFL